MKICKKIKIYRRTKPEQKPNNNKHKMKRNCCDFAPSNNGISSKVKII